MKTSHEVPLNLETEFDIIGYSKKPKMRGSRNNQIKSRSQSTGIFY